MAEPAHKGCQPKTCQGTGTIVHTKTPFTLHLGHNLWLSHSTPELPSRSCMHITTGIAWPLLQLQGVLVRGVCAFCLCPCGACVLRHVSGGVCVCVCVCVWNPVHRQYFRHTTVYTVEQVIWVLHLRFSFVRVFLFGFTFVRVCFQIDLCVHSLAVWQGNKGFARICGLFCHGSSPRNKRGDPYSKNRDTLLTQSRVCPALLHLQR